MNRVTLLRRGTELSFFVGALVLLGWLIDRVGWSEVGSALGGLGPLGVIVILLLGYVETIGDSLSLHATLAKGQSRFGVLTAHAAGSFVNIVAPWELGEVVKATLLSRSVSTRGRVGGVIIWNYAFKLTRPIVSLTAALLGATFASGLDSGLMVVVIFANIVAFGPYLVLRLLLRGGFATWVSSHVERSRFLGDRTAYLAQAARDVDLEVREFASTKPRAWAMVIAGQLVGRVASLLSLVAAIKWLGYDYSVATVLFIYAGLNVAEFVLTAVPAKVGVGESAAYGLFIAYGLDPSAGLVAYLVIRLKSMIANGTLAGFALAARERAGANAVEQTP